MKKRSYPRVALLVRAKLTYLGIIVICVSSLSLICLLISEPQMPLSPSDAVIL